ncbi:peptidoglycan-associated lipoprotein Pal [Desulfovibrio inopinatus]|uniref:peptidoglycan-associated lipoprotein Pal n=1 Tax=Desulfovibrio inopinatus TaxID=102109 RepID=UPI000688ADE8|nr:peptidoglycan-associated lipoprotein Pal [Desulfovibrio inopinatus]
MQKSTWILTMVLCLLVMGAFGCAKKQTAPDTTQDASWEEQERQRLARERELQERLGRLSQELSQMVFFDFDRYDLKPEARTILTRKAEILQSNPDVKLIIEGNCDERGTAEYNLALGERRARAAAQYLVNQGVTATRLSTLSYGKERPLNPAHNEAAWAQNRRDEFRATY